jgi:hypothetical protein
MDTLKNHFPEFAFSGVKVAPDDVGYPLVYTAFYPSLGSAEIGTAEGTKSQSIAFGLKKTNLDYPRNIRAVVIGPSGSTVGGTVVVNGLNQFGDSIQESIVVAVAADGGTTLGTKVFAKVTSGTTNFSSGCNAGAGTGNLGVGTSGTTTLFGLPWRLGGTNDVVNYAFASVSAAQVVGSAAIGSYTDTGMSAIKALTDFGTASGLTVWAKPTHDYTNDEK